MPGPKPFRQRGLASKIPQVDQPRGRARGRATAMKDERLAGYLARCYCPTCRLETRHLVLRHSLECKRCLVVRRRREGDPPPA